MTQYQGGKNGAGVYQTIINAIPPHRVYVEAFAGSAAIYRLKKPAGSSILIEKDEDQAWQLRRCLPDPTVIWGDAVHELEKMAMQDLDGHFFYLDPPYLHSTRKDTQLYRCELTDAEHLHLVTSLLPALSAAGAQWALSGYRSAMYDGAAGHFGWHRLDYQAMTRRGVVTESLWTNYDPSGIRPAELTFAGSTFRERERIKRKAARWAAKFSKLPMLDRAVILEALASTTASNDGRRAE